MATISTLDLRHIVLNEAFLEAVVLSRPAAIQMIVEDRVVADSEIQVMEGRCGL